MIEKIANRQYKMLEFPYFVPEEELEYNIEYANEIIKVTGYIKTGKSKQSMVVKTSFHQLQKE